MTLLQKMKMLINGKAKLIDVYYYIQGNYRYRLYYFGIAELHPTNRYALKKHPLMRKYIWEQINYRIEIMTFECYSKGSCIKCGCETTALQMANKQCEGLEYPPMMPRTIWKEYKMGKRVYRDTKHNRTYLKTKSKTLIFKETIHGLQQINLLAS